MIMTRKRIRTAAAAVLGAGLVLAGLGTGFVHVDDYGALHTYGVSAGTDSTYVSAEFQPWSLSFSVQDGH
jgi:hypothetical protein